MKTRKKFLAVVLAVLMILPIAVVAAELSVASADTIKVEDLKDYKIVYYDSAYAKLCAERIRDAIKERTGATLSITTDAAAEVDKEILVGKTNRAASKAVRAEYERPNVCYDIKVSGNKLVVMAEGYKTLDYAAKKMEKYLSDNSNTSFRGSVYDCDISPTIDTLGQSMLERAEGTDLRVFHWNMAAPMMTADYQKIADVADNKLRAELIADIILQMMPDVITTNEYYDGHWSGVYAGSMKELSEYYDVLASEYETGKPNASSAPINPGFPSQNYPINENILYKKDLGLDVVWSGWRYGPDNVYYHGFHTAVFEMKSGKQFLVSVGHYGDARTSTAWPEAHNAAIADAKTASGAGSNVPTIITGDMYTGVNHGASANGAGYRYWENQGYADSQVSATVNANASDGCLSNNNRLHGTFHEPGIRQIQRLSEDFIWTKNGLSALKFKVLTSMEIDDASDHYPVMADIKFN